MSDTRKVGVPLKPATQPTSGDVYCPQTIKDPKQIPLKSCPPEERKWSVIDREMLIQYPPLLERIANGLMAIERKMYGKVDTYGEGSPCNTYHLHLMLEGKKYFSSEVEQKLYAVKSLFDDPRKFHLLYHTEESTERFPANSRFRNLVDYRNGTRLFPTDPPDCTALGAPDIGDTHLMELHFAIISSGHELYPSGFSLPDGRRFIVWMEKERSSR